MLISELISRLEVLRTQNGNVSVEIEDHAAQVVYPIASVDGVVFFDVMKSAQTRGKEGSDPLVLIRFDASEMP